MVLVAVRIPQATPTLGAPTLSWPYAPYGANDPDQQARSNKTYNQVAQPSTEDDPKRAQDLVAIWLMQRTMRPLACA